MIWKRGIWDISCFKRSVSQGIRSMYLRGKEIQILGQQDDENENYSWLNLARWFVTPETLGTCDVGHEGRGPHSVLSWSLLPPIWLFLTASPSSLTRVGTCPARPPCLPRGPEAPPVCTWAVASAARPSQDYPASHPRGHLIPLLLESLPLAALFCPSTTFLWAVSLVSFPGLWVHVTNTPQPFSPVQYWVWCVHPLPRFSRVGILPSSGWQRRGEKTRTPNRGLIKGLCSHQGTWMASLGQPNALGESSCLTLKWHKPKLFMQAGWSLTANMTGTDQNLVPSLLESRYEETPFFLDCVNSLGCWKVVMKNAI